MAFFHLYIFPILVFILFPFTFILTYTIAVLEGHVEPDFPYISDTGTWPPESCIFGQLLNIGAVLLGITIYIRYKQIDEHVALVDLNNRRLQCMNSVAMWLGFLASFGISLVGNFQEKNVIVVHFIGAFGCFGIGTIYLWIQAIVSYRYLPFLTPPCVQRLRLSLSTICAVFFVVTAVTGVMAHLQFHGQDTTKWYPDDGGWAYHVASTASEWILACSFMIYILTFVPEFKQLHLEHPKVYRNFGGILGDDGIVGDAANNPEYTDVDPVLPRSDEAGTINS